MGVSGPVRVIIHDVAARYGLTTFDLLGERKTRIVAMARQEAMHRVSQERGMSLHAVARVFGGRDHTTILHGIRTHAARMAWAEALIAAGNADTYQPSLFAIAA